MPRNRRVFAFIALLSAGLLASGCSSSVDQEELEQVITDRLTEVAGVAPENVECPDDLEAEVDATARCTLTASDGSQIGVTVTVTEVEDNTATFDIIVDDEPMS